MKQSYLLLIFIFSLLISCNSKNDNSAENNKNNSSEIVETGELPELSVYNLPSNWTNQDGENIRLADFRGKIVVAVMIYTTCRASCPKLIQDMIKIHDKVDKKTNQQTKYVFVSIDPEIDTPKRLNDFSKEKGLTSEEWVFLRGTEDDTREFAATLGVNYKKTDPIDYAHSNIITVFDQNGVVKFQKEGLGMSDDEIIREIEKLN